MPGSLQTWDEAVLRWIGSHLRRDWLDPVVVAFTNLGNAGMLFILASALFLLHKRTRSAGVSAGMGMTLGLMITNVVIKPLVDRPRPWVILEDWQPLLLNSDPHSFPSGHATAAFAFAAAVCTALPQRWAKAAAVLTAAFMGFSRVYVGVHFPCDVLAGALIGTICGVLGGRVTQWLTDRLRSRKAAE